MNNSAKTQLVIIGAGPGGHTAAFLTADRGLNVTLIDSNPLLGGTCLHQGCIPSKTLLSIVQTLSHAKDVHEYGIHFEPPTINLEKLRLHKKNTIGKLSAGLSQLCKQKKITFIQGKASFINSESLAVEKPDGTVETITFKKCIIATGSEPITPEFAQTNDKIMYSSQALELNDIPKDLLIVGGGYIGLEMASIYAGLGSQVTICEMLPTLLSGTDKDLVDILLKNLRKKIAAIKLSTIIKETSIAEDGIEITFACDGTETKESFDKILIATGRKPNLNTLHLEQTKIRFEENGRIRVKPSGITDDKNIYAIGDVVNGPMLAHKASYEASVAINALLGKKNKHANPLIPSVIFTDPEIAYCGLTEQQAKEKKIKIEIVKFPWAANGRAVSLGRADGLTKVILDAKRKKILGVSMVGSEAGELIAQAILTIASEASLEKLASCIFPHPTLSETFKESLEIALGKSFYPFKRLKAEG